MDLPDGTAHLHRSLFSDEDVGRAEALRIRFIEEVGTLKLD